MAGFSLGFMTGLERRVLYFSLEFKESVLGY
jgi:hypothetical protein